MIPQEWRKYPVPSSVSINVWIVDFARRLKQLSEIKKSKNYLRNGLWLGGLFLPEAFITATRQSAAQAHQWSVENLELHMEILDGGKEYDVDATSFIAKGISFSSFLPFLSIVAVISFQSFVHLFKYSVD